MIRPAITLLLVVAAFFTLPDDRVTLANIAPTEGASVVDKALAGIGLAVARQSTLNLIVVKVTTVQLGQHEVVFVGLPFVGRYYALR